MKFFPSLLLGILLALALFLLPISKSGAREVSRIESIQSIPYPMQDASYVITQKIAHTDIYLQEPVFAKKANVEITYSPGNVDRLSAGIRSSSFWLSYQPQVFFDRQSNQNDSEKMIAQLVFPLTDKFQETDRSVDLMFFADYVPANPDFDMGLEDPTTWQIHSLTASVSPAWPTLRSVADYAASLLLLERAA